METGTTQEKITLAFINDKSPVLDDICNNLCISGTKILFRSENIKDGLFQLSAFKKLPKVCVIDLDFYDKNILEQLQKLRSEYPTLKLIAHSDIDAEKIVKAIFKIGFESYLLIGSDADDFKKAIEVVSNRKKYFSAGILKLQKTILVINILQ